MSSPELDSPDSQGQPPVTNLTVNTSVSQSSSSDDVSSVNSSRQSVDRYGFLTTDDAESERDTPNSKNRRQSIQLENSRSDKWVRMMRKWDTYTSKKYDKLKGRIRKGIPDRCRGQAWAKLLDTQSRRMRESATYYVDLVAKGNREHNDVIQRDLARTFPTHEWFCEKSGQDALFHVLIALANHNPRVGYCQGMGFITALVLWYLSEEEAFWLLVCLMDSERFGLNELFAPGFPKLRECFHVFHGILGSQLPKLHAHLESEGVDMSLYASQWFLTLFINQFSFPVVLRIWDMFLLDGWKVIFRVALLLLTKNEKAILGKSFDNIIMNIRHWADDAEWRDEDLVVTQLLKMKVHEKEVKALQKEYQELKKNENKPTMKE